MKNILFVTGNYFPDISATGNCIDNIASYFVAKGWCVYIIATKKNRDWKELEIIDGKTIYRIDAPFFEFQDNNSVKRICNKAMSTINNVLHYSSWPVKSNKFCKRAANLINELNKEIGFEFIIYSINPPHSLYINYLQKRMQSNSGRTITIAYYLDMLKTECHMNHIPLNISEQRIDCFEKKYLPYFDYVVFTDSHAEVYDTPDYNYVNNKSFIKLPSLNPELLNEEISKDIDNDVLSILYVGTIGKENRNPEKLIRFFDEFSKVMHIQIELDFYGKNEGFSFENISKEWFKCSYNGIVPKEKAIQLCKNADILLNIDNLNQNMIPSKIFEFVSLKKPIINITTHNKSVLDDLMSRYPSFISIVPEIDNESFCKLKDYLDTYNDLKMDPATLFGCFREYTPEPFYELVEKYEK